MNSIYLYSKQ